MDYLAAPTRQAIFRISRLGQENETYAWVLRCSRVEIDRRMHAVQNKRGAMQLMAIGLSLQELTPETRQASLLLTSIGCVWKKRRREVSACANVKREGIPVAMCVASILKYHPPQSLEAENQCCGSLPAITQLLVQHWNLSTKDSIRRVGPIVAPVGNHHFQSL